MGKKIKKKSRVPAHSPKDPPQQSSPSDEIVEDVAKVVQERKPCAHLDKGLDLDKLSAKIRSAEPIRCEDCRENGNNKRAKKGKSKPGKKKGSASLEPKSEKKAIWICLECGHYACGGIGLPASAQCHVVRHVRQTRHHLVIQWENPHLCWCFRCDALLPFEKTEENGENKDVFVEVVKLMKERLSEGSSVNFEDLWLGGGSVTSDVKLEGTLLSGIDGRGGYVVQGLINLGNTCFFNSIIQNLLALDKLREYFLNQDMSAGPLTMALKKLFAETNPEVGSKNVINPRSLFGSICSKAPQFRGYQQHDSHELLRCLLDSLSAEELSSRRQRSDSDSDGNFSNDSPTFVDAVFGGQISSTVCCTACGHSSTVYEPFLDLSLSVPTKKPPSKKVHPVSRAKKKLPSKSSVRIRSKFNKDADSVLAKTISNPSASSESPDQVHSTAPPTEKTMATPDDSTVSGPTSKPSGNGSTLQNTSASPMSENEQGFEDMTQQTAAQADDFTWLNYLDLETISDENDWTSQNNDVSFVQDSTKEGVVTNDVVQESSQVNPFDENTNLKYSSSSGNLWDEELPPQVQDSEILLLPYKEESSTTGDIVREEAEASSSSVSYRQDQADFDGFGDLFNEPEIVEGPISGPSLENEVAETGFIAGNNSDSDLDEVDDTDSPVSVESCLAHFVKPELLSNDNAWVCENCSKSLLRQWLEAKEKAKLACRTLMNGGETKNQTDPQSLDGEMLLASEVRRPINGEVGIETESFVSHNGQSDSFDQTHTVENGQTSKSNTVYSKCKERKGEIEDAPLEQSHSLGFQESVSSCSSSDDPNGPGKPAHKSEDREDEELSSKSVKVKRDATKRVLIDKAPPILTIHLKRFSQDARGRLSKLNGYVNFRELIDLGPYMDSRCPDREKYVYRLTGVVEHLGSMRGGHYVSYIRGVDTRRGVPVWYHASDAYVSQVSLEEVLRCEAYILLYEKI